ncbi:hypothetical protein AX16_002586 [Volvariella volvacea WC 439]|nr:hypothetical protein AX16_002586 [Volvariella volvacea WC 439]
MLARASSLFFTPPSSQMKSTPIIIHQSIEAKRKSLDHEISRLQGQGNDLAPIFHLAPELITNIITLYLDSPPPNSTERERNQLITIAQTCRCIRSIVIDYPSPWAKIDLGASKKWNTLCLHRSKGMPLDVHGHVRNSTTEAIKKSLEILKELEARIKVVDLFFAKHPNSIKFMKFDRPMPRLEELALHFHEDIDNFNPFLVLFPGHPESLLIGYPPDCAQLQVILAALSAVPSLRALSLARTMDVVASDGASSSLPDVHLPYLTKVVIEDLNPSAIATLISHIHHLSSTKLELISQDATSFNVGRVLDLLPSIAARIATFTASNVSHEAKGHIQSYNLKPR